VSAPFHRGRRLRRSAGIRAMVRETRLSADQLVAPLFVCPGEQWRDPIASMPGHARLSPDLAAEEAASLAALGVGSVLLFGIPAHKDADGSGAWDPQGPGRRRHSPHQGCRAVAHHLG
jgi:porphobilinogen synthase